MKEDDATVSALLDNKCTTPTEPRSGVEARAWAVFFRLNLERPRALRSSLRLCTISPTLRRERPQKLFQQRLFKRDSQHSQDGRRAAWFNRIWSHPELHPGGANLGNSLRDGPSSSNHATRDSTSELSASKATLNQQNHRLLKNFHPLH